MVILNIPMPQNCGECRLMVGGWCYALQADSHLNRYRASLKKRPEWCPIKEEDDEHHGRV